jgi:NADH-quinone oxidoreductase subunit L
MFSSEKHRKSASGIIGTLAVFTSFLASAYFWNNSNPAGIQISLFDWIQISNFK